MPFYECVNQERWMPQAIITCDCVSQCTEVLIMSDEDEFEEEDNFGLFYLSVQPREDINFWYRVKCAWRVLLRGKLDVDEMVLDQATVQQLTDWLVAHSKSTSEK